MPTSSNSPITFQTVSSLGLQFPGAETGTAYGSPALLVNGQMFACMAVNKSAEPNTLGVRIPIDQRDHLLAEADDIYYVTDHYVDYPMVLVRLGRIRRDALRDLLQTAYQFVTTEKRQLRSTKRRATRRR